MKVTVTALKASWPAGAVIGSVVEIPGATIPPWAVGKCAPAAADAEAAFAWEPPAVQAAEPVKPAVTLEQLAADNAELRAMITAQAAEIAALREPAADPLAEANAQAEAERAAAAAGKSGKGKSGG